MKRLRLAPGLLLAGICALGLVAGAIIFVSTSQSASSSASSSAPPPAVSDLLSGAVSGVDHRAVFILLPALDWPELRNGLRTGRLPNLRRLAGEGALGLMNTLTGGRPVGPDAYVTLGAGARAVGGLSAGEAFGRAETTAGSGGAGEAWGVTGEVLYAARLGHPAPPGEVLHAGVAALALAARGLGYPVEPGALGESLHRFGLRTAVWGNADLSAGLPPLPQAGGGEAVLARWAVAVAMDRRGRVDFGAVGPDTLRRDPDFPGGWRTDEGEGAAFFRRVAHDAGLVVIETGDLRRLEVEQERMAPSAYAAARLRALVRADRLIGEVLGQLDPRQDLLLALSPFPSRTARMEGGQLTPILAWGRGIGPGLLTSGTTRQPALVTNTDVAPAILAHLGIPVPVAMTGRPLQSRPVGGPGGREEPAAGGEGSMAAVDEIYQAHRANFLRRPALIRSYIILQIAVLLLAVSMVLRRLAWRGWLAPLLVSLTAVPLALLLLGALPPLETAPSYLLAVVLTAGVTALALWAGRRDWAAPFVWVAVMTVAGVALDVLLNLGWMGRSPLGHSPLGGARYYGIGNEYMGVLLGASLMAGTALLDRFPGGRGLRPAVLAAWTASLLLLVSPGLGANFGGTLAGAAAFLYTALRLFTRRPADRRKAMGRLAALGLGAAAMAALMIGLDLARAPEVQTHVARTVSTLGQGGWPSFYEQAAGLIQRKLAMNWKLIRWTSWSWVFLTSLGVYAGLMLRPPGILNGMLARSPHLRLGFSGVAVASLAALVLNDSGIVAAATTMIFASAPLTYLVVSCQGKVKRV